MSFAKNLLMEEAEAGKVWDSAHGRYDIAMKRLVADVLQEAESPEDKLFNALIQMRTPESTKRAAEAIQNGILLMHCYML